MKVPSIESPVRREVTVWRGRRRWLVQLRLAGMSEGGDTASALHGATRLRQTSKERLERGASAPLRSRSTSARSSSLDSGPEPGLSKLGEVSSLLNVAARLRRLSKDRLSAMQGSYEPQNATPADHAVRLRLQRVDFQNISAIDQVAQTFAARIFVIFDIPADAVDDVLLAGLKDEKGPFRSARFHLDCIEFVNLVDGGSVTRFLSKMPSGDLNLCVLAEGTFNVMYELQTFPYDHQSLSVQIRSKCANEKSAPVELDSNTWAAGIQRENFALGNVWELEQTVQVRQKPIQMGASIGLSYPGLRFAVHVQRKSGYYVINVVCPTGFFALLCGCQAWIPRDNVADRLSVSLTLLLTATAYKFVTASMLPAVACE